MALGNIWPHAVESSCKQPQLVSATRSGPIPALRVPPLHPPAHVGVLSHEWVAKRVFWMRTAQVDSKAFSTSTANFVL
jgi:hypothetical protein